MVFGRWIFWPKVPRTGQASLADSRSFWRRIGDAVSRHPRRFATVTLVLLAIAGGGISQIKTGLDGSDQFLEKPEAIAAGSGSPSPSLQARRTRSSSSRAAWLPPSLASTVGAVEGVTSTREIASAGGVSEIQAVLDSQPGSDAAERAVRDIRAAVASTGETHVGGTEAEALDEAEASGRDRMLIFPIILGLVLVALAALLRSVVAPVILVSTVVATYLASLGISWVLFTQVFGFDRLDNGVPLFAFVFLVALGVDYNIFLVTRTAEEAKGHGPREGMLRALAATGGVITSAGVLLAAVFAVLGVLPLVVLAQARCRHLRRRAARHPRRPHGARPGDRARAR